MKAILIDNKRWEKEIVIDEVTKTIEYYTIDLDTIIFELDDSRDGKPVYKQKEV